MLATASTRQFDWDPVRQRELGRPSKLSPFVLARLIDGVSKAHSESSAAAFAGINRTTLHRWKKRGEAELFRTMTLDGNAEQEVYDFIAGFPMKLTPANPIWRAPAPYLFDDEGWPYALLVVLLARAHAQATVMLVHAIWKGAKRDWRAAAWLLERQNPNGYGRQRGLARGVARVDRGNVSSQRGNIFVEPVTVQSLIDQVNEIIRTQGI